MTGSTADKSLAVVMSATGNPGAVEHGGE